MLTITADSARLRLRAAVQELHALARAERLTTGQACSAALDLVRHAERCGLPWHVGCFAALAAWLAS